MNELSHEQAVAIFDSRIWEKWTNEEIVKCQLFQEYLCLPFPRFHEAMEAVFDRPIWTHEFADQQRLIGEYLGVYSKPTFQDIVAMLPQDKVIILGISPENK